MRIVLALAAVALLLGGCSQGVTVGTAMEGFEEVEVKPDPPVVDGAEEAPAPGRDVITAAAQNGEPHILWFWGAN